MKKGTAVFLALILVLGFAFSAAPALAAGEYAVVVNTGYLNVRSQPSASSQWLGSAVRSSWVEVLVAGAFFLHVRRKILREAGEKEQIPG